MTVSYHAVESVRMEDNMIDLHLHLDGSLEPNEILELANIANVELPTKDIYELKRLLTVKENCTSLSEYLEKFALPQIVLQTIESMEESVYMLIVKLAKQGLCYAEIRFAPQFHTKNGLTQKQVVLAAIKGLNKGIEQTGMQCQLILCCMRNPENLRENMETVYVAKEFLGTGVCAIDLAGNEAAYPTKMFAEVFEQAKNDNIPIIIHAGEAAGAESVREALKLGAVRIGHGIHVVEDDELLRQLKTAGIMLETCFTSNLQTKAVHDPKEYPILKFIESNILVSVNTDNMTVSGTSLKKEYNLLKYHFSLSDNTLKRLALNAVTGAFVSEEKKKLLREKINNRFIAWLNEK